MDPTWEAFLRSWPLDPWVIIPLLLTAFVYSRGWHTLHFQVPHRFGSFQLYLFLGGLLSLFLALASPLEPFADLLLQVHMLQHLLLMMVAPPLLWLGAPLLPFLRCLPMPVRHYWAVPFLRLPLVRCIGRFVTHPVVAWSLLIVASWVWHFPPFYEAALRSPALHALEHACFLGSGLLFWWPVVQPYPSRIRFSSWWLLPYLFLADIQNTLLSALFTFSGVVLYPYYLGVPRLWGISATDDQIVAGVLMWVPGSIAYSIPLIWIGARLLYGDDKVRRRRQETGRRQETRRQGDRETERRGKNRISLPLVATSVSLSPCLPISLSPPRWDLLRFPILGTLLKWRRARPALQVIPFVLAAAVIADGWWGPPVGPMNLAGVVPWIHWRGLLVLALLAAGNVFCMACPFLVPRTLARRWLPACHAWPRWLRGKWLAVALLALFFWAYEAFSLWDSPWWTAWIALGYFVTAFAIDGWFRGAAFCKYVCPIGQFNFVQSLVSPFEVRVRDPRTCQHCATKDCLRGGEKGPGCELHLFLPRKAGNLDCTFCLDCIHACPHENVGILTVSPGAALWHDSPRSGIGRLGRRPDLAALVVLLTFAAFINAAGMVAPVVDAQDRLASAFGLASPFWIVTASLVVGLLGLPLVLVGGTAALSRLGGYPASWLEAATRFAYGLAPLGCGMWLAHYSFHLLTSAETIVPVIQRAAADLGMSSWGSPTWTCGCCMAVAPWVVRLEIVFLDLGLLLSLYTAYRICRERFQQTLPVLRVLMPWAVLLVLLFAAGIWIVLQPMEMRGTMPNG